MKVFLCIQAVEAPYTSGCSPELEMEVFRTEKEARDSSWSGIVLGIQEHELVENHGIRISSPNTRIAYQKWYRKNGRWANKIVPYIGWQPFLPASKIYPFNKKKKK